MADDEPVQTGEISSQRRVIEQLEERNRLLREQVDSTDALRDEVAALRAELADHPTRAEVPTKRWIHWVLVGALVGVLALTWVAIWLHEQYRDSCEISAPHGGIEQPDAPAWCDWIFPGDGRAGPEHLAPLESPQRPPSVGEGDR